MPAVSQAQRRYIFGVKGEAFARRHHFDNPGKLPKHAKGTPKQNAKRALAAALKGHTKRHRR